MAQGGTGMAKGGVPFFDQRVDYDRVSREWPGVGCVWPKAGAELAGYDAAWEAGFGSAVRLWPIGTGIARSGVCMA